MTVLDPAGGDPPVVTVRPRDDPRAYVAADRRQALADGRDLPDRVTGAALFLDVSGFTPLTEALVAELGPRRGADEIAVVLADVFEALIDRVHAWGGVVIYFSGDAVTCWLDGDDGSRAVACGLDLQRVMAVVGRRSTPGGRALSLGAKVAVAVGPARRFVVGDPSVQLIEVLGGRIVDHLAAAEGRAEVGQVVLDASAVDSLGARVRVRRPARDPDGDARAVRVVEALTEPPPPPPPAPEPPDLPDEVLRQWLLPAVHERMGSGAGEFLAELRPGVPVFVSFDGIEYDRDEAPAQLDGFVVAAQRVIDGWGGSTLQLTLGDKGAYLYAVFGSPLAHEDDAARACSAALDLLALEGRTAARNLRIGITHGRLRSGTYGHPRRRTFCCLGDAVNLAARLMSRAGPGEVWVSPEIRRAAEARFVWRDLPPLTVKGKRDPVQASAVLATTTGTADGAARLAQRHAHPMLGREAERAEAEGAALAAIAGRGRVLEVVAEAGMGKSRLVAEVVRLLTGRGVAVHAGECPAHGATTSYLAWRDVWWDLLGLGDPGPDGTGRDAAGAALRRRLETVDPALAARAPLLGPLLDLPLPDTDLTAGLDAKLRKASLEDLLATLLERTAAAGPLALVLEDAHWMDPLSQDLLGVLARHVTQLPVLLVITTRPAGPDAGPDPLAGLAHRTRVELGALGAEHVRRLVAERAPDLTEAAAARVVDRAEGNPFYVEELLAYLRRGGDAGELPDSLATLVLSRIDRLPEGPRSTAKVASVVGRTFTPPDLHGVYRELGPEPVITAQVGELTAAELTTLDDPATSTHSFRHVIVRDVAYESLPTALRTHLHERVGDHLTATRAGGDQLLDLLAYHYGNGADPAKKRRALLDAGRAAQGRYANATAIRHYRDVLPLLEGAERGEVLLALGQVLELTGAWNEAEEAYLGARGLAGDGTSEAGWAEVALAEIDRKQGRFAEADRRLDAAADEFSAAADEPGSGRVLHLRGTLAAQQGRYAEAGTHYEASLAIRRRLDDLAGAAALLSNLGVIAEYTERYDEARRLNEEALAARTALGDRWAIGVSQNNLGMVALLQGDHAGARARFAEALRLHLEVGDAWMVAVAHNNLGNALRGLGELEGARHEYGLALAAYLEWDDTWATAILLEDVAVAAVGLDRRADALRLLGAAERLREELGSPRAPALAADLAAAFDPPQRGDDDLLAAGRELGLGAAADLAREICEEPAAGA